MWPVQEFLYCKGAARAGGHSGYRRALAETLTIQNEKGLWVRCNELQERPGFVADRERDHCHDGWPPERFLTGDLSFADIIHPADSDFTVEHVMGALGRHEKYNLEYRIFHRDGQIRWVSEYASAIFDERCAQPDLDLT